MESHFGHDFTGVRVHRDAPAAASAAAIDARAYTVGQHVVFAAGQYQPGSAVGFKLLTHELAHTIQQRGSGLPSASAIVLGASNSPHEHEAASAAEGVGVVPSGGGVAPGIQRKTWDDLPVYEERPEIVKPPEPVNHAKQTLSADERKNITAALSASAPAAAPTFSEGPRFVLHDTASRVELTDGQRKQIDADFQKQWTEAHKDTPADDETKGLDIQKKKDLDEAMTKARQQKERTAYEGHERNERGPLDEGAAAWVPEAGSAVIARPQFFDPRRPTTTQWERREDKIALEPRERALEKVWQATKPSEQQATLQASLAGLELTPNKGESEKDQTARAIKERTLTPTEAAAERKKAEEQLAKPLPAKFAKGEKPHLWTTAAWSVEKICAELKTKKAEDLAVSKAKAPDLEAGCQALGTYFALREPRLSSTVNVEISKPAGSACNWDEKHFKLVELPPYTASQYQQTALVYLQAALQADQFPEVTTHFALDSFDASGHCDPRCFDLQHFYDEVAGKIGHKAGALYGIKPNYGTTRGTHNVWWQNRVCGGGHP